MHCIYLFFVYRKNQLYSKKFIVQNQHYNIIHYDHSKSTLYYYTNLVFIL